MITLRLSRAGTKKRPVYHIVAADHRARRDGRFVEDLGYYIPNRDVLVMKRDRVDYWLSVGATTSETVHGLIKRHKKHGDLEIKPKAPYTPGPAPKIERPAPKQKAAESPDKGAKEPEAPAAEAPSGDVPSEGEGA